MLSNLFVPFKDFKNLGITNAVEGFPTPINIISVLRVKFISLKNIKHSVTFRSSVKICMFEFQVHTN
jgi:hypothetical protein